MNVHFISLGAGVQSSTMALMASKGEIKPMPIAAIFADTKNEPESVYRWLDYLTPLLAFPVIRVSKGDLYKDSITLRKRISGPGQWCKSNVPAFVKNKDGSKGILPRQCTREYKIRPIRRMALSLMRKMGSESITQWIGISLDEVSRMKPSGHGLITNRWPLIELRKTRHDCLRWMKENGFPNPPRSACTFCPYHSDQEWRRLREEDPLDFLNAVAFDKDYRHAKTLTDKTHGQPFLHDSLVPLDEVDFSTDADRGQQEMFNNECEGMCGV